MGDPDELEIAIEDFAPGEIHELLASFGSDLSPEQAEQLAAFVAEAGGIEAALEALGQLEKR